MAFPPSHMQWAGSRGQRIRGGAALPRKPLAILWEQAVSSPCYLCPNSHLQFFLSFFFFWLVLYQNISEKAKATHSSTPAWKIPWTEEPGELQSMGSLRVGQDWETFTFSFHFPALEKEMATHSSVLAWRIPGTGKPGRGLPSMGSHRVWHDEAT